MTDAEAAELGPLVEDAWRALATVLGCANEIAEQLAELNL